MSTSSVATPIPKVRTYAGDLDFVRTHAPQTPRTTVAVSTPVVPTTPKPNQHEAAIPPFHTFEHQNKTQSQVKAPVTTGSIPLNQAETQNILNTSSQRSSAQNHQQDLPAVIITDTKHKRFKLGKEVVGSIKDWFATTQGGAKKKKTPQYTVPEAGRRKGVIQKATSQTGRTTTADHTAVVSRIKATKQAPVVQRINLPKPPLPVPPVPIVTNDGSAWGTEPAQTTTTKITPIVPVISKAASTITYPEPIPTASEPTPVVRAKITPVIPQMPAPAVAATAPEVPVLERQDEDFANFLPMNVVVPEREERPERRFAPPREPEWSLRTFITQTNPIVLVTFVFMVIVVAGVFGIRSLMNATPAVVATPTETTPLATFMDTAYDTPVVVATTIDDIRTALLAQSTESLTEIKLLNSYGGEVTASEFFEIINATVVFDFKASITQVKVGTYRKAPWIMLSVTDKTTALGGMLGWESSLYRTLAPLLPVTALNGAQKFSDGVIDGTDVRILKDTDGTEILVYGFTSQNAVLITSDSSAFLNLKNKTQ